MIYVDTNVIIRLIEGTATARAAIETRLEPLRGTGRFLLTSQLSRLESRTKPLRDGDALLLKLFDRFFAGSEVQVQPITADIIDKATEIRALQNIRTPDAIHLATAIQSSAESFLTGDKDLARCQMITVEIL